MARRLELCLSLLLMVLTLDDEKTQDPSDMMLWNHVLCPVVWR